MDVLSLIWHASGMGRENEQNDVRRKIVKIASEMLAGQRSFIEGARLINSLHWDCGLPGNDTDFTVFVGIDSETDALPFGNVRTHWAPDALAKLQPDIDAAEQWAKNFGSKACENLIARFGKDAADDSDAG